MSKKRQKDGDVHRIISYFKLNDGMPKVSYTTALRLKDIMTKPYKL